MRTSQQLDEVPAAAEADRLRTARERTANWKRWGPYLAERQWGTVREDYSPDGRCWDYFPHDQARSRAYRWGEDGLLGITDRECRLCFAMALWNGRDPILKERMFGLTNEEGNHGEDVKEEYFFLDSTPSHSYMRALYKYPQAEFPYERLVAENRRRGFDEPEFELADKGKRPGYGDMASKFFEHFIQISDAMNHVSGSGLWDEQDGFYYDRIQIDGGDPIPLKIRSLVGLLPLIAVTVIEQETLDSLPGFKKRFDWFLRYRTELARQISWTEDECQCGQHRWLLALPNRDRLVRLLTYALDESEFLSPHGIRSLSKVHGEHPFVLDVDGCEFRVSYGPGESTSGLFGGNSNWRGPVWFPINYLLIEALERYHHYYGEDFTVECPSGSGRMRTLREVAHELSRRLASLFLPDAEGRRPCHGGYDDLRRSADGEDLLQFHEFFHGETGRGLGASHQTGWTALVTRCL